MLVWLTVCSTKMLSFLFTFSEKQHNVQEAHTEVWVKMLLQEMSETINILTKKLQILSNVRPIVRPYRTTTRHVLNRHVYRPRLTNQCLLLLLALSQILQNILSIPSTFFPPGGGARAACRNRLRQEWHWRALQHHVSLKSWECFNFDVHPTTAIQTRRVSVWEKCVPGRQSGKQSFFFFFLETRCDRLPSWTLFFRLLCTFQFSTSRSVMLFFVAILCSFCSQWVGAALPSTPQTRINCCQAKARSWRWRWTACVT